MAAGGYRPNSGPMPGTKYRPRANKKEVIPKIPKKRGRPPKVKVDKIDCLVDIPKVKVVTKVVKPVKQVKPVKPDRVKKIIKPDPVVAITPTEVVVVPAQEPIIPQPTSLVPADIENAAAAVNLTPLEYLLSVMNNPKEDQNTRIRVAGMIAPFIHTKPGERTGKKEKKEERADVAAKGKFSAGRAPLSLVR